MDVNDYNSDLDKWGGYPPPKELESALCEADVLKVFEGRSSVPQGELDRALSSFRNVVVIATKLKLRVVNHSDGYYFLRDQR